MHKPRKVHEAMGFNRIGKVIHNGCDTNRFRPSKYRENEKMTIGMTVDTIHIKIMKE